MERGTADERALIRRAIEEGEVKALQDIVSIVRKTGALEATREAAYLEAEQARRCLDTLPASPARDALLELCSRSIHRSS